MTAMQWSICWAIARRDLHAGFRGLRLLFVCLFLGVVALATIGSLTASITAELAARGRTILGGDIEVAMTQRAASAAEKVAIAGRGRLSETIRMRAMARSDDGDARAILTELKGVDGAYPLYGQLVLANGKPAEPLGPSDIVIDRALAERLLVGREQRLRYGEAVFQIRDIIAQEPDRVGEGFTLGPVAIVSMDGLRRTQLIQPGSLFESKYRVRLRGDDVPSQIIDELKKQFPAAGWEYKDRDRAAPGASRFFERMGQFLSLIGLAALVIAGIGVSNGVTSYLAIKRGSIATLKILGATSADVARVYLMQIAAVAALAVICGVAIGALLPITITWLARDLLPVRPGIAIFPLPLVTSATYAALIAVAFALPPLARARMLPAAALFRTVVDRASGVDKRSMFIVLLAGALVVGLAVATARDPLFALIVLVCVGAVLFVLLGVGWIIRWLTKRAPRPRHPLLRLALANMHRPGSQTIALVIALGLALTLFVTLAAIQTSLTSEISKTVPARAPKQFVLDIPSDQQALFETVVKRIAPEAQLNVVPALRGTIVAYGRQRVADLKKISDDAWFLRGERGVTFSEAVPEGSVLVEGRWWPRDYAGPPLVSLDRKAADVMQIGVGDTLTVSVLGREIRARVASLRDIHWDTMGFNYVLIFSPNALAGAPHSLTATIDMDAKHEGAVSRALINQFPSASIISVGEVLGQVRTILYQMATAIVLAASVAILAGIAVLVGAIVASRQSRSYDSVILKTLGATRGQVLGMQAIEYGLLGISLAAVAFALGILAAWYVIVRIFEFAWAPNWWIVLATLAGGIVVTLGIGLIGSLPLMSVRPAQALRKL